MFCLPAQIMVAIALPGVHTHAAHSLHMLNNKNHMALARQVAGRKLIDDKLHHGMMGMMQVVQKAEVKQ